ncbi:hypothetical protein Fmac_004077 [Flemingia macrophylla]|uniref:CAP-Gly domain-containing protein n=1 Tax=Flemingia macrophylla TaxID=520843 RepID=A0ABD1N3W8_9FABA
MCEVNRHLKAELIALNACKRKKVGSGMAMEVFGEDSVMLRVTHSNLKTFACDMRFAVELSVEAVKEKLWRKCGTSVNSMHLELYSSSNYKLADLSDNSKTLGFYSPLDGFRLHVVDLDPASISSGGWLEDTSLVEKYKISEEAYNKRQGIFLLNRNYTFRKYKEKFTSQIPATAEAKIPDTSMGDLCANIKVGSRCEVEPGAKRGVVKFVGPAEPLGPGFWVGVQYDEPLGKHDGVVKGVRYFECPPSHGGMVRPEKVKVGDYPERDPFEEDEI